MHLLLSPVASYLEPGCFPCNWHTRDHVTRAAGQLSSVQHTRSPDFSELFKRFTRSANSSAPTDRSCTFRFDFSIRSSSWSTGRCRTGHVHASFHVLNGKKKKKDQLKMGWAALKTKKRSITKPFDKKGVLLCSNTTWKLGEVAIMCDLEENTRPHLVNRWETASQHVHAPLQSLLSYTVPSFSRLCVKECTRYQHPSSTIKLVPPPRQW